MSVYVLRAIVGSIVVAWIVGLAFLTVLLFSIQDINSILNTSFNMPVAQLFQVSFLIDALIHPAFLNTLFPLVGRHWYLGNISISFADRYLSILYGCKYNDHRIQTDLRTRQRQRDPFQFHFKVYQCSQIAWKCCALYVCSDLFYCTTISSFRSFVWHDC